MLVTNYIFLLKKIYIFLQSNFGCVSLNYEMSDQPVFGEWTIQVVAQGQIEEATFLVEEYYQTRFEVYLIYFIINN